MRRIFLTDAGGGGDTCKKIEEEVKNRNKP